MTSSLQDAAPDTVGVTAEVPGVVIDVYARPGRVVAEGEPIALLESMKMEIPVLSENDGVVVSVDVEVGEAVRVGAVVASVRPPVAEADATVCVIVPTRNEADNVAPLLERVVASPVIDRLEIVFVDDSDDDTPDRVRAAAREHAVPIRVLHRAAQERTGGLGGAVVAAAHDAEAPWSVVMDGDLQHPPEVIADMVAAVDTGGADLVVASRYVGDGSAAGLASRFRGYVSTGAAGVARLLFPDTVGPVTDPMSGFFAVRTDLLRHPELRPHGFKILLELLMRTGTGRVREVPMTFGERVHGDSKAGAREALRFVRQLVVLAWYTESGGKRLARFGTVGITGLLVNLLALQLLLAVSGVEPGTFWAESVMATAATQVAVVWNFALTELWVFRGRAGRTGMIGRFGAFWGLGMVALAVQLPLTSGFQSLMSISFVTGSALALIVLSALRFTLLDRLVYRRTGRRAGTAAETSAPTARRGPG